MDEIEGTGAVPNRARVMELAKELGFRQIGMDNYEQDRSKLIPAASKSDYNWAADQLAQARLAYDEAFARWAAAGFPD